MPRHRRRPARGDLVTLLLIAVLGLNGCATTAYQQGRSALRGGDVDAAVASFDAAIRAGERPFEARRERAAALLEAGRVDEALQDLEAARPMLGEDPRLAWLLGRAYSQAERYAEAAEAYREYEALTNRRSAREAARLRVAQLERSIADAGAQSVLEAQRTGTPPEPNTVAVFAFQPEGGEDAPLRDQKLCRALNIWVSADLSKVSSLRTIAVDQLDRIYSEQQFTYANRQFFDPASLVGAGNVQPARHMVRGLYASLGEDRMAMGAACYDAVAREASSCSRLDGQDEDLFDLETRLVLDILAAIGVTPTPAERLAIGEKPTRNLQAFLAFADGVYLYDLGQYEAASDAFAQAAAIDPGFAMAAQYEAQSTISNAPNQLVSVPPPAEAAPSEDRAMRSALQLGLGLIPDDDDGDGGDGGTTAITTVRGEATLRVTGRAGGNR